MGVTGVIYYLALSIGRMGIDGPVGRMLPKHTSSVKLFCSIDGSALLAVMFVLVVVMMIAESAPTTATAPTCRALRMQSRCPAQTGKMRW